MRDLMKPFAIRSLKYLAWIRTLPCLVLSESTFVLSNGGKGRRNCSGSIEAAHSGEHGLGTKSNDIWAIPLCESHHRHDNIGLDSIGPLRFEAVYNVDIKAIQLELIARYVNLHLEKGKLPL